MFPDNYSEVCVYVDQGGGVGGSFYFIKEMLSFNNETYFKTGAPYPNGDVNIEIVATQAYVKLYMYYFRGNITGSARMFVYCR